MEMQMDLGTKASRLGFSVKETELRAQERKVNGNKTEWDSVWCWE